MSFKFEFEGIRIPFILKFDFHPGKLQHRLVIKTEADYISKLISTYNNLEI